MEIWRGLGRLNDVIAFPGWPLRIVSRRCQRNYAQHDRLRDLVAQMQLQQAPEADSTTDHSGEQAVDLAQLRNPLQQLLSAQLSVLALFYPENLSVAEVACALDVSPGTVKTRQCTRNARFACIRKERAPGKLDEMIEQALSAEDEALLASHSEPGYFKPAFGLFRGPLTWVIWLMYVVASVAFGFAVSALWQVHMSLATGRHENARQESHALGKSCSEAS